MAVDEFFCKKCRKSTVGTDGFCVNCGHNPRFEETEESYDYEEEDAAKDEDDEYGCDKEEVEEDFFEELNADDVDEDL